MITKKSLELFQRAVKDVPAYKNFIEESGINPSDIKKPEDLNRVPLISKKTYLEKYPLKDLMWDGTMKKPLIFCSTSGSTGMPFYFPRNEELSEQYSYIIEDYLKASSFGQKGPVLVLVAFGMGVWIGGVITLRAFEIASNRMKAPVSVLPIGYNKPEVIKALQRLSPQFEQTIIVGYPPFVKEIVDEAKKEGIDLKALRTRLLFAAEAFTETFRDYLSKKTGANPVVDTLNIYGTADIGAMAYETPASILIRRLGTKNKALFKDIFGQIEKTPTLAQFNPDFIEFHETDQEVILTGNSALPLVRYAVGDRGGVIEFDTMQKILKKNGIKLRKEAKKAGITSTIHKHPFVFVYERTNFSVTLHGINIFPEFIKEGLLDPELADLLTEKFTMITKFDRRHNQYLEINLELQPGVKANTHLKHLAKKIVRDKLIEKSSEFAEISKSPKSKNLISLVFWHNEHPKYFAPGVKQKWVLKEDQTL